MKRKVWHILLTLCMVVAMMPAAAFAGEDGVTDVTTEQGLKDALASSSVTKIQVTGDLTYRGSLDARKKITINEGVTLTISCSSNTTVTGTIVNKGTIEITGQGQCIWSAKTTGSGKIIAKNERWGDTQTYVDYGCAPENMLENCRINIVDDISKKPTVSLPENMTVGDTITPTVTNLIDGVDISKVFTYKWRNGSSFERYNGNPNPTLTKAETLNLNLSAKKPYIMRSASGSYGSIDASGTVANKTYDVIYVDNSNGNNNNEGTSADTAVKTLATAMDKVSAGGIIILCGDYEASYAYIEKSVAIKSRDSEKYTLSLTGFDGLEIKEGANVTLESLAIKDTTISGYGNNASKSLALKNCTGSVTVANNQYSIEQVTLDGCELSGDIYAKDTLQLISSQLNGKFTTKDFTAKGSNSITVKKNTPCVVTGTITTESPVTLSPANLQRAEHLIEVPSGTADAVAEKFQLADTTDGLYALKCRTQYNGTYIEVSKRIDSAFGKIAVAYEPIIQGKVMDSKSSDEHEYTDRDFADDLHDLFIESSTWSGYTNTTDKTWALGDKPELTIVLSTDIMHNNDSHFDEDFSVNDLKIYSWTGYGEDQGADYSDQAQNRKVKLVVKDGQGLSNDGRTFTFTVQYPEVTRLDQTIKMDTSARTAHCGEELNAREATAKTTLSYESSDPEIASVDPVTGKITAHKPGAVTITVKAAQSDLYSEAAASYTLTVSHDFGDTWKHDETSHWKECACGEISEKASHSGGKATTTEKAKCSVCSTEYGDLLPAANDQKPGSTTNGNGAKTGDGMPIGLLAVLMLAAGAGIAFCGRKLYKSR